MIVRPSKAGTSRGFLARVAGGGLFWVKTTNNAHGLRAIVAEQIVGRVGALFTQAVCAVHTIEIPGELDGKDLANGLRLEAGIAHGSLAVDGAFEIRGLEYREED